MHAGIPAAVGEYLRFKNDTLNFIIPVEAYLIGHGRRFAELGDLENATLTLQFDLLHKAILEMRY